MALTQGIEPDPEAHFICRLQGVRAKQTPVVPPRRLAEGLASVDGYFGYCRWCGHLLSCSVTVEGDTTPTYYVVPTAVIDEWLRADFIQWVSAPGAKGQQRAKDNKRRIIYMDDRIKEVSRGYAQKLAPYKGAWNLLSADANPAQ